MTPSDTVDQAITSRFSCRAFTAQEVPRDMLTGILNVARQAASGTNTQPWKVYVLRGEAKAGLVAKACAAHDAIYANPEVAAQYRDEYDYYPTKWVSPYIERRRDNGWGLYGVLGIGRGDKDKMHAQHQRNYKFFDAPIGLMFTVSRNMGRGSLVDYGMFLQNIMLAARARGLHTCAQGAWNGFAGIIKAHVGASTDEMLVCGMALGYADDTDKVNSYRPSRISTDEFTTWLDQGGIE